MDEHLERPARHDETVVLPSEIKRRILRKVSEEVAEVPESLGTFTKSPPSRVGTPT
jgi:hypothetical protein